MNTAIGTLALSATALCALFGAAPSHAAPLDARPNWRSPAAVMHWAEGLNLKGWDYLGSADDSIFFVGKPRKLADGHRVFPFRVEFFDPANAGPVVMEWRRFPEVRHFRQAG